MKPLILVCGPSGSGKTTVASSSGLRELVSYTTRPIREGEVDGRDYHFVSLEFYQQLDTLVDSVLYNGNYYGAALEQIVSAEIAVLELDGVVTFSKVCSGMGRPFTVIGITASEECRRRRMLLRGDSEECAMGRIINDRVAFSQLEDVCDTIIDTTEMGTDRAVSAFKEAVSKYENFTETGR